MHLYSHMTQNSERFITRWQQIGFFFLNNIVERVTAAELIRR